MTDKKEELAEHENVMKHIKTKQGLPAQYVQIISFIFLIVMFATDKIAHSVTPPLEDVWYIVVATIAFFGSAFSEALFEKLLSKKP